MIRSQAKPLENNFEFKFLVSKYLHPYRKPTNSNYIRNKTLNIDNIAQERESLSNIL